MTFMEAVEAMREGKVVRRRRWETSGSVGIHDFDYLACSETNEPIHLNLEDYLATDWEIVEEDQ